MKSKGLDRYNTFGLRLEWIKILFEAPTSFWHNERMGTKMFCSFNHWGQDVGLLTAKQKFGAEFDILVSLGFDSLKLWGLFWVNAAYNSLLIETFVRKVGFNSPVTPADLLALLGNSFQVRTRWNALRALQNTFRQSPLGLALGQGICDLKGNSVKSITRTAWLNSEPLVILYSLFLFAAHADNLYKFTLSYLLADKVEREALSPQVLFGLGNDKLRPLLQALAEDYPDFIRVNFNKGIMDNIYLNEEKSAAQVVRLFSHRVPEVKIGAV